MSRKANAQMDFFYEKIQAAHLAKFYGGVDGVGVDKPLPTVTTVDHNALVATRVEKVTPGVDLHHWTEVRALLNEYCGYHLADDEILLLCIGGEWYFISDIGLRIQRRECYVKADETSGVCGVYAGY